MNPVGKKLKRSLYLIPFAVLLLPSLYPTYRDPALRARAVLSSQATLPRP